MVYRRESGSASEKVSLQDEIRVSASRGYPEDEEDGAFTAYFL